MITDNQHDLLIEQYYDRGVLKKEIRSYEVSLWTLQDEFITVLKWSDVEQKGRIESPKMILNIDGTEKFNFKIPMYYRYNGRLIENPNWYNTKNGNLMVDLRKTKVIFNKGTDVEAVFEFIITNITETHEKDMLTCEIESEGLAFQELGKVGYKISLSSENFELSYKNWVETGSWIKPDGTTSSSEPIQNIQYWCEEAGFEPLPSSTALMNSRTWYYEISMNWDSYAADSSERNSSVVYEEGYTSSWNEDLTPAAVTEFREKARAIEVEKSNLYNITKTIAEKFEVFCKYQYLYDSNYHIIGRKVVFYNNFIQDGLGTITLQYPYSSSKVSRTMDAANVTTKLFVLDVDEQSITESEANASQEDYILNFDFLYMIGAINQDQYDAIQPYLKSMRKYNQKLSKWQNKLIIYESKKPKIEAKKTVYERSIALDEEQIAANQDSYNTLDVKDKEPDGYISLFAANPDRCRILTDKAGRKYLNLDNTNKGIVADSIKAYGTRTIENNEYVLKNEITGFAVGYDETTNNVNRLTFTTDVSSYTAIYLIYKYDPQLYYQKIIDVWTTKKAKDEAMYAKYSTLLGEVDSTTGKGTSGLLKKIDTVTDKIKDLMAEKNAEIKAFERLMGPALREGYWQPEDYTDYGDRKTFSGALEVDTDLTQDTGKEALIGWDSKLFEEEDTLYYEYGPNKEKKYYPCVDLNAVFPRGIPSDLMDYSIVWKATNIKDYTYNWDSIKDLQVFPVKTQAVIKFIKDGGTAKPILMVTGAQTLSKDQISRLTTANKGEARLEKYSVTVTNGRAQISHDEAASIGGNWITIESTTQIIYPRIKFSALTLKTDSNNLIIKYNSNLLKDYVDYYIDTRIDSDPSEDDIVSYYITIKPEVLIKYGLNKTFNINYVLSNANTAIYADASKISKENAFPKVSYAIQVNLLNTDLIHTLYNKLARIVMVNDVELKFENTFGYISQVELDLDNCQNDSVEIKNYKTKFEDLFSTIVAQTEAMKRTNAGEGLANAISGGIPLSEEGLTETIGQNTSIFNAYLDSYFDSSQVIKDRLTELFKEAGEILGSANGTLNKMKGLTLENASILNGFVQNVAEELTGTVFRQKEQPVSFKTGDIWIEIDDNGNEIARYVATYNSSETKGTGGWVRTSDGTLAQIKGAGFNYDAEAGTVDIYAEHKINLRSGKDIYIGANDTVDIVGNKKVNIGGGEVNITGTNNPTGDSYTSAGINIIATGINYSKTSQEIDNQIKASIAPTETEISKVLIHPTEITLASADILMRGSNIIQMVTSRGTQASTSAIEISPDTGVWIGSGQGVRLFSGGFSYDAATDTLTKKEATGASVELNSNHLMLGFMNATSNNGEGTAIEMTQEKMVIAAGNMIPTVEWESGKTYSVGNLVTYNDKYYKCKTAHTSSTASTDKDNWEHFNFTVTGSANGLVGAEFTSEKIGFATSTKNGINAIVMNKKGITIGSGSIDVTQDTLRDINNGSYVRVSGEGIELGSLADLYINTDNFKLQTHSRDKGNTLYKDGDTLLAVGKGLQSITYSTTMNEIKTLNENNSEVEARLVLNNNGLYLKGDIEANSFILNDDNAYSIATTYALSTSYQDAPDDRDFEEDPPDETTISSYVNRHSGDEIYIWTRITTTIGKNQSKNVDSCEHIKANGSREPVTISYTVNFESKVPNGDNVTWYSSYDDAKGHIDATNKFLVTRTGLFQNQTWTYTYEFRPLYEELNRPYVKLVETLYYLGKSNSTAPSKPTARVTTDANSNPSVQSSGKWSITIPNYDNRNDTTITYYYWTCLQQTWVNSSPEYTWTTPQPDQGLSVAYQHATEASEEAARLSSATAPITAYGIIGKDSTVYTPQNSGARGTNDPEYPGNNSSLSWANMKGYPMWDNVTYGLILGNNQPLPMLIGGNNGITIVDTNNAAGGSSIVLKSGGIGMHGSTINFTAVGENTSAIAMDSGGIHFGSGGSLFEIEPTGINLKSQAFKISITDDTNYNFLVNTDRLSETTEDKAVFSIYTGGSSWTAATSGIRFSSTGGLRVKASSLQITVPDKFAINTTESNPRFIINLRDTNAFTFRIDTTLLASDSTTRAFLMYNHSDWDSATAGIRFGVNNGLDLKATSLNFRADDDNYIKMNSSGVAISGNKIKVNGKEVFSREDILFGTTKPKGPKDRRWIWIKPNGNLQSTFTITPSYNDNVKASIGTVNIAENQRLAIASDLKIKYTITVSITISNGYTTVGLKKDCTLTSTDGTNTIGSITVPIDFGPIYSDGVYEKTADSGEITTNLLPQNATQLTATFADTTTVNSIKVVATVSDAVAPGSRMVCDVYYYEPDNQT